MDALADPLHSFAWTESAPDPYPPARVKSVPDSFYPMGTLGCAKLVFRYTGPHEY